MTSRSEVDQPLSAAAISYAERGWPVFPLIPRGKTPLTKTGFKEATTALDVVEAWWDHWPNANVGLATGHAFDVLDVDGIHGGRTLQNFIADRNNIGYRHEGPVSYTGKGWHALFLPTGRGNGAALLGPGSHIDFRGLGGYIVAPPSIHPDGHAYRWDPARGINTRIPEAPEWLLALLSRDDNPAKAKPKRQVVIANAAYDTLIREGILPRDQAPRSILQRIDRPDILEVCAEKGIELRKRSHYYVAACVYHEDSTPSMAIYTSNQTFYCYGCGAHGDSYDLRRGVHL